MSVMEMAQLRATPGREDELAQALPGALAIIETDPACLGAIAYRCIERPSEFTLTIGWDSVAEHDRFRESEEFGRYRAAMAGLLGEVVDVSHYDALGSLTPRPRAA